MSRHLLGLFAAAALLAPVVPAVAATHTVVIDKMAFSPAVIVARVGDTVAWVNRDLFRHSVLSKKSGFDLDLPVKSSRRTTMTKVGSIDYICGYHPGMTGRIVVKP